MSAERPPQLDPDLVVSFVGNSHGDLDEVKRLLGEEPALDAKGPHGIPLVAHAEQGGEQAREVVELLSAATVS